MDGYRNQSSNQNSHRINSKLRFFPFYLLNSMRIVLTLKRILLPLFSFFLVFLFFGNYLVKDSTVNAVTETRYMRGDTATVNGLNTYQLGTSQSSTGLSTLVATGTGNGNQNQQVYWGIRVWKRNSSGTETEITSGTPVAQVTRTSGGIGLQSATWTPTATSLDTTDSIVVRVYIQIGTRGWQQGGTIPDFTTGQLNNNSLSNQQWTIYYYTEYYTFSSTPASTRRTEGTFYWGTSTYNSRIENFSYTSSVVTVGTSGTQVSSLHVGDSNKYIGGAFTFITDVSNTNVTSITISETGTISDSNISGLVLYYKQESTCSTTIPVDATQFNSTPGTFSSGSSTVTGSMSVGTSQICVYPRLSIGSGAQANETIDIQITNPSTQISVSIGTTSPSTAIAISGTTTLTGSNSTPSFTNFTENGPVNPGSAVTFTATASDPDTDNVYLVVCKTAGVTGNACDGGAGDTWCTSSAVASNPSCQYSTPSVYPDAVYNVYPYVFDSSEDLGSLDAYQGAEFSFTVNNVTPVVSAVTINGGTAISLEAGTTKAVTLTATVTDNNSCFGSEISSVLGYVYRSGIGYSGCDTAGEAENNYCYPEVSCTVVGGTCTDNTDASANYTCTVNLQYYADPTDDNTQYPTEFWMDTIKATDNNSATHTNEVSTGVKLSSLTAFNITTSVNYGTLGVGEKNDPLDKVTIITPTGNVGLDHEVYGPANMCTDFPTCAGATIAIEYQKYALSTSTPYDSAAELTTTAVEVETNVPKVTTGTPSTRNIWWGMLVPTNTSPGTYNGNINITGIKGETLNW